MELTKKLDNLVKEKVIKSWEILNIDCYDNIGESDCRNTERLIITFNSDEKLTINTFCSGSSENTCFC